MYTCLFMIGIGFVEETLVFWTAACVCELNITSSLQIDAGLLWNGLSSTVLKMSNSRRPPRLVVRFSDEDQWIRD
jgi:hypothetical protein